MSKKNDKRKNSSSQNTEKNSYTKNISDNKIKTDFDTVNSENKDNKGEEKIIFNNKNALLLPTRKNNTLFVTSYFSDKGDKKTHNNHFTYKEFDNFACWILSESSNGGGFKNEIAPIVGEMILDEFSKNLSMNPNNLKEILLEINKRIIMMQHDMNEEMKQYSYCSFVVMVSDYSRVFFANVGNSRGMIIRDSAIKYITCDDSKAHIEYEKGIILHDEIRFRKDKTILIQKFGLDAKININISETMALLPGDKALLLSQGSWENLGDYDILSELNNNVRCGQWISGLIKKIRTNNTYILNNFTLCGVFFDRPIAFVREPTLWEKLSKDIQNHYRKALLFILVILLIFSGNRYYKNYKLNKEINDYIAQITRNIKTGDARIELPKFEESIDSYNTAMNLYEELKTISKDDHSNIISDVNSKIKQSENGIKIQDLLKEGDIIFENDQYLAAKNKYQQAKKLLDNIGEKNSWFNKTTENIIKKISVCEILEEALTQKLEADPLYDNRRTKRRSLIIYEKIAHIFRDNNRIRIYEEIIAKLNVKEEHNPTPKIKKEILIVEDKTNYITLGDDALVSGRWTESLNYYKKALENKKYNDPIIAQGKINVNNILLKGVNQEVEGDNLGKTGEKLNAITKYNNALAEYSKLKNNKYLSNSMYQSINSRVQSKLNTLK